MCGWTTYQYDTVKDGYIIYGLDGEIMKPYEVTEILNDYLKTGSLEFWENVSAKLKQSTVSLIEIQRVLENILDE